MVAKDVVYSSMWNGKRMLASMALVVMKNTIEWR